jgi:hypothetical protein
VDRGRAVREDAREECGCCAVAGEADGERGVGNGGANQLPNVREHFLQLRRGQFPELRRNHLASKPEQVRVQIDR